MKKKSEFFLSEKFQFLVVKFSIYLKRRVFVMLTKRKALLEKKNTKKNENRSLLSRWCLGTEGVSPSFPLVSWNGRC